MFKSATRIVSGPALGRVLPKARPARRFVSTAPPHQKSRSWKSSATRWGLAGAFVYYYNTSSAFAEEPAYAVHAPPETSREHETYPTVETISEQRKAQTRPQTPSQTHASTVAVAPDAEAAAPGSPEALEEEASQQGAFNEETGEINWDCPCLGGMAYGPCGEQFRAAFSCFVFSKDEPKGVDCIEQFKMMQNCFREHPDVYGSELEDDEASSDANLETDDSPALIEARKPGDEGPAKSAEGPSSRGSPPGQGRTTQEPSSKPSAPIREEQPSPASSHVEMKQHPGADEADDKLIPKAWHDSRETATGK